jgi:hypothetical protein
VVTGYWRKVFNEELNDLYCLPNIVWMAMSVMRWRDVRHYWVRVGLHRGFWWGNLKERNHLEVLGLGRRILLKWILKIGWGVDCINLALWEMS